MNRAVVAKNSLMIDRRFFIFSRVLEKFDGKIIVHLLISFGL